MTPQTKAAARRRLARIEGQVRGLSAMVEQERYCIDIVTQVRAARAALAKVEQAVLADHMESCVETAIAAATPTSSAARWPNWSTCWAAPPADRARDARSTEAA